MPQPLRGSLNYFRRNRVLLYPVANDRLLEPIGRAGACLELVPPCNAINLVNNSEGLAIWTGTFLDAVCRVAHVACRQRASVW